MKKEFSKYNSLALKGIAILIMFFHHNFRTEKLFANYDISFFPFTQGLIVNLSDFFKICVSIFAFISGYGLAISIRNAKKGNKPKSTLNRIVKLILDFMIVAIIMYIIRQIVSNDVYKIFFEKGNIIGGIVQIIVDLLGMNKLFGTSTLDGNWWYMSFAILLIMTIPIIIKCFDKYGYLKVILAYIILPRILHVEFVNSSYITFVFPAMLGIICADKNLLVKWANKFQGKKKILKFILEIFAIVLLFLIYENVEAKHFYELKYGVIPTAVIFFLYEFIIEIPIIKNILEFLGKHSMNMFFIHGGIRIYCIDFALKFSNNFLFITAVWFLITLAFAILIELLKKLIKFEKLYKVSEKMNIKYDIDILEASEDEKKESKYGEMV